MPSILYLLFINPPESIYGILPFTICPFVYKEIWFLNKKFVNSEIHACFGFLLLRFHVIFTLFLR